MSQPMRTAPKDRPIFIIDRDDQRIEAEWDRTYKLVQDDDPCARGAWRTDAGWITPDEAVGWNDILPNAIRAHQRHLRRA